MFGGSSRKRASRVQLGSPRCARPNLVYLCALIVRGCFAKGSLYSPCHGNTRTTPARERALHGTHSAPGVSGELCPKLEAESKAAHRRARTCRARARSMRSAQSPCSSTRPRCARARPSARLLRGAMVAWSDRQEWEEAAAVERAHSKLPQRRRSPPASAMALRSWSPIGRRSQRIARDQPSPPPRPGVHQPAGAWVRDDGGSGGGGSDRVGGAAHLRAVLAGGRLAPHRVVRQLGPEVLAGIRTGRPTRWGRGIKGGGAADIHWNDERGAAARGRTWRSSKGTGPICCGAESALPARCARHRWTSGGGGEISSRTGFVNVPPQSGLPARRSYLTFICSGHKMLVGLHLGRTSCPR